MTTTSITTAEEKAQNHNMQRYYRFQSAIYDATRWSFLFGRKALVQQLPFLRSEALNILEVGCGTGFNLDLIAQRFPHAHLTGLDLSGDMLQKAKRRLRKHRTQIDLLQQAYPFADRDLSGQLDAIVFSYSLSMINPQWQQLLVQAQRDLKPNGLIAVVDFHHSRHAWFRRHMLGHHVRMEAHLLPELKRLFPRHSYEVKSAYGGVWGYLGFMGRKG